MREMEPLTPAYLLSRHAYVCLAPDMVVLLDVETGKYLSIGRDQAAALGAYIVGWPLQPDGDGTATVLRSLIDRRLVTQDPVLGKPATCFDIALPTHWIREGERRGRPQITSQDVRRFIASVAFAACGKRFLPLKYIVARAQRRARGADISQEQAKQLASLVRIFDWLRPLAFKKTDECFLYCFALSEFLSRYGMFPSWVFAVRSMPFAAHCWLQQGDRVLTDIPFNLRRMVPILVL